MGRHHTDSPASRDTRGWAATVAMSMLLWHEQGAQTWLGQEQSFVPAMSFHSGQPRFDELPADVLMSSAVVLRTAAGRAAMISTCKAWRDVLADSDELWRVIALHRFPRLHGILQSLGVHSPWVELYREQLRAERAAVSPEPGPTLADFVLSIELYSSETGAVSASWTGKLSELGDECDVRLWDESAASRPKWAPTPSDLERDAWWDAHREAWWDAWGSEIETVRVRMHLSRWSRKRVHTVQICDIEFEDFEDDELVWHGAAASLRTQDHGEDEGSFVAAPRMDLDSGSLYWLIRLDTTYNELDADDWLQYARVFVPWSEM